MVEHSPEILASGEKATPTARNLYDSLEAASVFQRGCGVRQCAVSLFLLHLRGCVWGGGEVGVTGPWRVCCFIISSSSSGWGE